MALRRPGESEPGQGKGLLLQRSRRVGDCLGRVPGRQVQTAELPKSSSGSLVIDRVGNLLAFDRGMEQLTGWMAFDVVGRHKDLGFYGVADEQGVRHYQPTSLFDEKVPLVDRPTLFHLTLTCRDGEQLLAECLVAPLGGTLQRFEIKILKIVARLGLPAGRNQAAEGGPPAAGRDEAMFLERLNRSILRCREAGQTVAVMVAALDDPERMVATYGGEAAEEVMIKIAGLWRASLRESDLVARLDQWRLGVLLESTGRGESRQIGGRIRATVEKFQFLLPNASLCATATISVGAASFPTDSEVAEDLLGRAGEAIQEARRMGGNRVWCYVRRPRVPLATPVFFDGVSQELLGMSRDLSNSGIFVQTEETLPRGMRLGLQFHLPGAEMTLRTVGRVARHTLTRAAEGKPGGLGIEFERFSPETRRQIEAFIADMVGG